MLRPFVYTPPQTPLEIIYIDSSVVVLNKPAGLLTVPGRPETHSDCLLTRVRKEVFGALLVHRLDLDTSGIIIFARTASSQVNLGRQFEERRIRKIYRATVSGYIKKDAGLISLPIVVDWPNRPIQKVCFQTGKDSITRFKVLERPNAKVSLVELYPVTGRTHQLRLHMKSIGHPILGDSLYADEKSFKASERLNLHASSLEIIHPKTDQTKILSAPVPF